MPEGPWRLLITSQHLTILESLLAKDFIAQAPATPKAKPAYYMEAPRINSYHQAAVFGKRV